MSSMILRSVPLALLLGPWVCNLAGAGGADDAVHWRASVTASATITHGSSATLEVSGEVQEGWHVYGLEQQPRGPTPLRISLEANPIVAAIGPTSATLPETVHDLHFGFDTQLYTHPFTIHVPVQVSADPVTGRQLIPVSVRFQACSDRECLLPRTVHLFVLIDVSS